MILLTVSGCESLAAGRIVISSATRSGAVPEDSVAALVERVLLARGFTVPDQPVCPGAKLALVTEFRDVAVRPWPISMTGCVHIAPADSQVTILLIEGRVGHGLRLAQFGEAIRRELVDSLRRWPAVRIHAKPRLTPVAHFGR